MNFADTCSMVIDFDYTYDKVGNRESCIIDEDENAAHTARHLTRIFHKNLQKRLARWVSAYIIDTYEKEKQNPSQSKV